jgi:hypothetical protein
MSIGSSFLLLNDLGRVSGISVSASSLSDHAPILKTQTRKVALNFIPHVPLRGSRAWRAQATNLLELFISIWDCQHPYIHDYLDLEEVPFVFVETSSCNWGNNFVIGTRC